MPGITERHGFIGWINMTRIYAPIYARVGASAVIICAIAALATVVSAIIIGSAIDNICCKYLAAIIIQFFTFRVKGRARYRAKCAERAANAPFIYTTRAAAAFAVTSKNGDHLAGMMIDITELYNCLIDQQLMSAMRLRTSVPDLHAVYVKFANDIGATIDIDRAEAVIHWYNNTDVVTPC